MRFVLHNPHTLWYKNTIHNFISKTRAADKYEPLFDYFYYNNKKQKVYVYLDNASFISSSSDRFFTRLKIIVNFYLWVALNKLKPFRFSVIAKVSKLKNSDILLTFIYENFTNSRAKFYVPRNKIIEKFKNIKALKVVHLSHYGYHVGLGSKNSHAAEIDLFVSENNLTKNNNFFRHYFPWYKDDVYVLPYLPQKRFIKTTSFNGRINKVIAMGTITYPMDDADFVAFFNDTKLQPMRHEIYDKSKDLTKYIDSFIAKIDENKLNPLKRNEIQPFSSDRKTRILNYVKRKSLFFKILLHLFLHLVRKKKAINYGKNERNYFKKDIVTQYNNYKMFIVPEEVIGLPGIGFVEGMACGCAYIGLKDPMYSEIGMKDKVHYIGYDGTLEDLKSKIEYYQNNPLELENIANAGYEFVKTQLNENVVGEKFCDDLMKLSLKKQTINIKN